jgi:hypothetical protein
MMNALLLKKLITALKSKVDFSCLLFSFSMESVD